jgi:NTE family protein
MNEAGLLGKLDRVSSVSGGSIVAAVLGLNWSKLAIDPGTGVAAEFDAQVVRPVRALAGKTIDAGAILGGVFLPGTVADRVTGAYREHLYGNGTLQDLPDVPRFVINATNVQSGVLWRFSKPFMGDYRVGLVRNPRVELAVAVAASSAFPPVLSPADLDVDPAAYEDTPGVELTDEAFRAEVVLSDGGAYDNLGLETAWKRYQTILVSDGGGRMEPEAEPARDWARHSVRILAIIDSQVRSLRKRQVIDSFKNGLRTGAYWGIHTHIQDYKLPATGPDAPLPCPDDRTQALANTPTRLGRVDTGLQERLINWGYAVCDAALRKHYNPGGTLKRPNDFPYPAAGV